MKRATDDFIGFNYAKTISIHALVKRATAFSGLVDLATLYFNPRPREEGDDLQNDIDKAIGRISIHALVKRAT